MARLPVLSRAAKLFEEQNATLFFDLSPLWEERWTGIAVVAAGLAGALLEELPEYTRFFRGYDLIDPDQVADAIRRNTGLFLERNIWQGHAQIGKLPVFGAGGGPTIGLFPSVKFLRGAFDVEVSVFHDLSTIVMPLMHIRGNVLHHTEAMIADLASNDLTVAVSEACRHDLIAYLGATPETTIAAPNGVAWPDWFEPAAGNAAGPVGAEPYFLILGTREPRKNIVKVFELLEQSPELLEAHRFVFAGKMGWLEEQHALPRSLESHVEAGRILFPGFVSDFQKYALLRGAQATLYPSYFEGFGLPVLESLSVGTPCVASWSSSIPEVGGDVCEYFDPLSTGDFEHALRAMLKRSGPALSAACRERAAAFTWRATLGTILERVLRHPAIRPAPRRKRRSASGPEA